MFLHYIKTAWRNIRSNWVYSLLSVCCLAIGTTMFARSYSYRCYQPRYEYYEYNRRPLYDRSAIAYEDIPDDENYSVNRGLVRKGILMPISFEMMAKLDLPEIEYVSGECQGDVPAHFEVSDSERVYLNGAVYVVQQRVQQRVRAEPLPGQLLHGRQQSCIGDAALPQLLYHPAAPGLIFRRIR